MQPEPQDAEAAVTYWRKRWAATADAAWVHAGNSDRMVSEDGVNFRPEPDDALTAAEAWWDEGLNPNLDSDYDIARESFLAGWTAALAHPEQVPAAARAAAASAIHQLTCRAAELNATCDGPTTRDFDLAEAALAGRDPAGGTR